MNTPKPKQPLTDEDNPFLDDGPMSDDERADEASKESFPASDPPATSPHRLPKKK